MHTTIENIRTFVATDAALYFLNPNVQFIDVSAWIDNGVKNVRVTRPFSRFNRRTGKYVSQPMAWKVL